MSMNVAGPIVCYNMEREGLRRVPEQELQLTCNPGAIGIRLRVSSSEPLLGSSLWT